MTALQLTIVMLGVLNLMVVAFFGGLVIGLRDGAGREREMADQIEALRARTRDERRSG